MRNLRDLEEKELKEWVLAHHFPVYRAEQIYRWVMEKDVQDFSEMLNLPKNVREVLQEEFTLSSWQYGLYFHTGRMQDGLCFLCFHAFRPG